MLKYFILSLFFLSLAWQVLAEDSAEGSAESLAEGSAEDSAEFLEQLDDDDFEVNEFNDTDVVSRPKFLQVNINDKIYSFHFQPVNWHMAREQCTSQNQVLASIHSHQESLDIQNYLYMHGVLNSDSSFWIGASDLGHIGQWTWVSTGRPSYYSNWQNREPCGYCNRHCVELMGDAKWNNNDCDLKRPIICQNLPTCSGYGNSYAG